MTTHSYGNAPQKSISSLLITGVLHAIALGLGLQATNMVDFRQATVIELTQLTPPVKIEVPEKVPKPSKTTPLPSYIEPPAVTTTSTEPTITTVKNDNNEPRDFEPTRTIDHGLTKTENSAPRTPIHIAAQVDSNACEKPDYPASSIRSGEEGTVNLAMLIGPDGRVLESKVEKSSGSRALDKAAIQGLSLCKFKPGSVDGVPEKSWAKLQYVWTIN
nr:TonB family protein [uncultured Undibacterium sp.]